MTTFDDREKSAEKKFALDEEALFKAHVRRDKLFGMWAAAKMGLSGAEAKAYADGVVSDDIIHPGDKAIAAKVMADLKARGFKATEAEMLAKLEELFTTAKQQIAKDIKG